MKTLDGHVWASLSEIPEEFKLGTCEQFRGYFQGTLGILGNDLVQVSLRMDNHDVIPTSENSRS